MHANVPRGEMDGSLAGLDGARVPRRQALCCSVSGGAQNAHDQPHAVRKGGIMTEALSPETIRTIEIGAQAFVTAMTSDTWEALRARFAQVLRTTEASLDSMREQYLRTPDEQRSALVSHYTADSAERLRGLILGDPAITEQLKAVLGEIVITGSPQPLWPGSSPEAVQHSDDSWPTQQFTSYDLAHPWESSVPKKRSLFGLPLGGVAALMLVVAAVTTGVYYALSGSPGTSAGASANNVADSQLTQRQEQSSTQSYASTQLDPGCLSAESAFRSMQSKLTADGNKLTNDGGNQATLQSDLVLLNTDLTEMKSALDNALAQARQQTVKDKLQTLDSDVGTMLSGLQALQQGDTSQLDSFQAAADRIGPEADAVDSVCSF